MLSDAYVFMYVGTYIMCMYPVPCTNCHASLPWLSLGRLQFAYSSSTLMLSQSIVVTPSMYFTKVSHLHCLIPVLLPLLCHFTNFIWVFLVI